MISAASNVSVTSVVIWMPATPGNGCRNTGGMRVGDDRGLLAERAERQRHRHRRADRIAVGSRVRRDDEPPSRGE